MSSDNYILSCIDYDILLEYLSYIKSGTIAQFKQYINNVDYEDKLDYYKNELAEKGYHFSIYNQIFSMFSRLGHIEFDYINSKFAVCPPTLVVIPNTQEGFIVGSRTKGLKILLKTYSEKYKETDNSNAPKCIKIKFEDLNYVKERFPQLRISENFSDNVLKIVPNITVIQKNLKEVKTPIRQTDKFIKKYNPIKFNFENSNAHNLTFGLYEEKNYGYNTYYLYDNQKWYEIDRNYGIFIVHNKEGKNNKIMRYEDSSLYIKLGIQLPELIDRALTMYSGFNPEIIDKERVYVNIDIETARYVADILGQHLGEE